MGCKQPMSFDVLVVGGGTAGCALVARLSENPDRGVCLVEAGPDYGPLASGHWPEEMVDAHWMPWTLGWGSGARTTAGSGRGSSAALSWIGRAPEPGRYEVSAGFHMKPRSTGRVRIRSTDPAALPLVERGFLSHEDDLSTLVEAIEIGRTLAATEPLRRFVGAELRPGRADAERYLRNTVRDYFHPAGTCPLHEVLDTGCRVHGIDGLLVADASVMPTIPRANTNLTTAAIAERAAANLA
jgi:choline dehydrogenase-like flavoprotein